MIQTVRPALHSPRRKMEFRRMQIARRRIYAQGVTVPRGRDQLRGANGGRIKQQLRKQSWAIDGALLAIRSLQQIERRDFATRWIGRKVQQWRAFVMPERIGHILPIEKMLRSPQRLNAVLGGFVILAPGHRRWMPRAIRD